MLLIPIRCFVIDDNHHDYEFFERAVKDLNLQVECKHYSGGEEALDRLNNNNEELPQMIFIDINMPRMSGIDFLMQLKLSDRLADIPVYIHSTVDSLDYVERTKELGVAGYIIKSSNRQDLTGVLRDVFQQPYPQN